MSLVGGALCNAAAQAAARLGPRTSREADLRLLRSAADVGLIAYEHPGFEDRLDAAGKGAESARDLVAGAQAAISVLAQLAAVTAVVTTLDPLLMLLVLVTAIPRAYASLRAARIEHAAQTAARADNRMRTKPRGHSTDRGTAAETRAADMGGFLSDRYRQVSDRLDPASVGLRPCRPTRTVPP
ncbi:hypothetical protein [Streptomyces fimbriatus]|uniref:hypothetical protein n=1 Tax=Streptomyces fimbriatus TaxID=68197 RepID=UPI0031D75CCD